MSTTTIIDKVNITPTSNTADSFGRIRQSSSISIFDNKQVFAKDTTFFAESITGSATSTFVNDSAAVRLTTTTANGDEVIRQTKRYFPYHPGQSQVIYATGVMGALKNNVRTRIGYFDANNGIFFEQDGTNLKLVIRTSVSGSPVDTPVNQSAWNLDKLDGTGDSGVTVDMSKAQLFVIDFTWFGVGTIRAGFVFNGRIVYCHQFDNENLRSTVYMSTPSLPVRFEITNTGATASNTSMDQICTAVVSEGLTDPLGFVASTNLGTTGTAITQDVATPLIAIRAKAAFNRMSIVPLGFSVLSTGGQNLLVELFIGGTISGGTWSSASDFTEVNTSGASLSGGQLLTSSYIAGGTGQSGSSAVSTDIDTSLFAAADVDGTVDPISLIITPLANDTILGSLTWKEFV